MNPHPALVLLAHARIRTRRIPLLWALSLALLSLGYTHGHALGWWNTSLFWAAIPGFLSLAFLAAWWLRGKKLTDAVLARQLDSAWSLSSRLESSVELAAENTALADAQRADTSARAGKFTPPDAGNWLAALSVLALVALFTLGEFSYSIGRSFFFDLGEQKSALTPAAASVHNASILWEKPSSEIKATAIEEVPLVAWLESTTVPEKITLEASVNGEPRFSQPLDAAALAKIATAGTHTLNLSLYLDELRAQEFDVVAYHLRADFPAGRTPAVSPMQFIQIRPSREDVIERNEPAEGGRAVNILRQLKAAQLRLVKENFQLLNDPRPRSDKVWSEANTHAAEDQRMLSQKTAEFRELMITRAAPTLVVDNLGQAAPLMQQASDSITAIANADATAPQNRALALITAIEKIIQRTNAPPPPGEPEIADPFKDEQRYKLPERAKTPAGRLEELARKQADLADELNNSGDSVNSAAAQADVAKQLKELAAEKSLSSSVQESVERATRDAEEAASQLAQNDRNAARAPAASAATHLAQCLATQESEGRKTAVVGINNAMRLINEARRSAPAQRDEQLTQLSRELRESALAQQNAGSSTAAQELKSLGDKIAQARDATARDELPLDAAGAQVALSQRAELLARVERQLERVADGMAQSQPGAVVTSEAEIAAQLAEAALPAGAAVRAREVADAARKMAGGEGDGPDFHARFRESLTHLIADVRKARASGQRDELVRRFNPDDFDPAYRKAIETYFEQLSRRTVP